MSFLREDFNPATGNKGYMKLGQGDNRFRILSDAIDGYVYWLDKNGEVVTRGERGGEGAKPVRVKTLDDAMAKNTGAQYESKQFVAFVVWNYEDESAQILELTQKTLIKAINGLYRSEDWGDPKGYDIVIGKKGEKLETEYTVTPIPPKPFKEDIDVSGINLEALYESGDPFLGYNAVTDEDYEKNIKNKF